MNFKKLFILLVAVVAFVPLLWLVVSNSVNVLFWDQWDYYGMFFQHNGLWDVFSHQHGHHRMGIGGLIMELVNMLTHWNMSILSVVTANGIFLITMLMLWVSRIQSKGVALADACIAVTTLTLTQIETTILNVSLAQVVVPSILVLLYAIVWRQPISNVKISSLAVIQFALLFSGYGVTFFPVTVVLIVVSAVRPNQFMTRTSANLLLIASMISAAVYCHGLILQSYTPYLRFAPLAMMKYLISFGVIFSGFKGLTGNIIGGAFFVALIFIFIQSFIGILRGSENQATIFLLSASVLSYMVDSSVGRTAIVSRYMTVTCMGLALLYIASKQNWFVAVLISGVAIHGSFMFWQARFTNSLFLASQRSQKFVDCYSDCGDAIACNTMFTVYPRPQRTHMEEKLQFMKNNGLGFFR